MLREQLIELTNSTKSLDQVRNKRISLNLRMVRSKGDAYYKSAIIKSCKYINNLNDIINLYVHYNLHHIFIITNDKQEKLNNELVYSSLNRLDISNFSSFKNYFIGVDLDNESPVVKDLISYSDVIKDNTELFITLTNQLGVMC
jgi:hypothetical protein